MLDKTKEELSQGDAVTSQDGIQQVLTAALFAAQKHEDQRRKGMKAEPYLNHLIEVAQLVASATTPADTQIVVAALLHDSIEDVGVTEEELASTFSPAVGKLVMEVTDDKSLPKKERKRLQVVNAPNKSRGAGLIKLADKISNLRAIRSSPPVNWTEEQKMEYVAWASDVVNGLTFPNPMLMAAFKEARLGVQGVQRPLCSPEAIFRNISRNSSPPK